MKAKIIFSVFLVLSIVALIYCQHMTGYYYDQVQSIPLGVESDFAKRASVTNEFEFFNWATLISAAMVLISAIGLVVSWIQGRIKRRRTFK